MVSYFLSTLREDSYTSTHHDGEKDEEVEVDSEDAEEDDEAYLDASIEVDPPVGDGAEVLVVRPVLVGDEEQLDALQELHAVEGGHAQVQDKAVQDGKREEVECPEGHDREADEDGHNE